jgi:ubiquitin-like protein Pup
MPFSPGIRLALTEKRRAGGGDSVMAEQTRQTKAAPRPTKTAEHEDERQSGGQAELVKKGEELTTQIDDLLDEIDEVLEENAEEFVKGYIQRGGQ